MSRNSDSEMYIPQSSFSGATAIKLSENKSFESLFAGPGNDQAVYNLNFRTKDLLIDHFKDKEDFWRGITIVTDEGNSGKTLLIVISAILSSCFICPSKDF